MLQLFYLTISSHSGYRTSMMLEYYDEPTDTDANLDCLSLIDGRYSAGYKPQMPHISSPRWKDKKGKLLNKPSKFAARIVV